MSSEETIIPEEAEAEIMSLFAAAVSTGDIEHMESAGEIFRRAVTQGYLVALTFEPGAFEFQCSNEPALQASATTDETGQRVLTCDAYGVRAETFVGSNEGRGVVLKVFASRNCVGVAKRADNSLAVGAEYRYFRPEEIKGVKFLPRAA